MDFCLAPCSSQTDRLNHCIEGWIEDQWDPGELDLPISSWTRQDMDEPPQLQSRSTSPSKRQKTSDTTSASRWADRVSHFDNDAASGFLKESSSATSASRAASPTKSVRSRRVQLEFTKPAIFFGPPRQVSDSEDETSDTSESSSQTPEPTISQHITMLTLEHLKHTNTTDATTSIPPEICELIKRFSEEAIDLILPSDIVARINMISPTESFFAPKASDIPSSTNTSRKLLKHVSIISSMARDLYAGSYDEAAWYPLIRMVLMGPPGTSSQPFVKHEEAHTRLVCTELLPQQNGKPIPTVKVDHMLQFNPRHKHIGPIYKPVFQSQPPSFSLSAFNDPVTSKTFTCAIVEAKAPGGNFQEASYQIAIASAAILERVKLLDAGGDIHDYMPIIGWIVHGHFWTLHVSYRETDGSIRVLGPYPSGNTATYLGVYRLIQIVQDVKIWGRELYFPYLLARLQGWQQ